MNFPGKYENQFYALMRIVIGLLFISHGIQKLGFIIGGTLPASNILLLLACLIESAAGLMIITGWQTRWAAFISSGEMAVAYFKSHQPIGLLPIQNRGELAVLYCFVFLFIAAYGSGIWSIDRL
ncbi:MAG: DoxX family protein, partial [Ignavibacteriaceae bacterium]